MTTTYAWTDGAQIKASPQHVGEALDTLQARNGGRLTPRVVVDFARPTDSPLHPCFEWDDVRAAELYREDQARHVVRCIRVVQAGGSAPEHRRVFVNVVESIDGEDQHGYVPVARVLSDEGLRQQVITQARNELVAFKRRYSELSELVAIAERAIRQTDALLPEMVGADMAGHVEAR